MGWHEKVTGWCVNLMGRGVKEKECSIAQIGWCVNVIGWFEGDGLVCEGDGMVYKGDGMV